MEVNTKIRLFVAAILSTMFFITGVSLLQNDYALANESGSMKTCSILGNEPPPSILDQDIFKFYGTKGEAVTVHLGINPSGSHSGEKATLIVMDIKRPWFFREDRSALDNEIRAVLPATGEYLILVNEQPKLLRGIAFKGAYYLSLESTKGAWSTLEPTFWVEPDASSVIGSGGGVVEVTDHNSPVYGASITFPPEALNEEIMISMSQKENVPELPPGVLPDGVAIEFKPNGSLFEKLCLLRLPVPILPADDEFLAIAYYSYDMGEWQLLPIVSYDPVKRLVEFATDHFSVFLVVRVKHVPDSVSLDFDVNTDSLSFQNENFKHCPEEPGVCNGIAIYSKWYYENHGHGLKCLYGIDKAEQIACEIQETYTRGWGIPSKVLEWFSWLGFKELNVFDYNQAAFMIDSLRKGKPTILGLWGWDGGIVGHAVLVTGWTRTGDLSGYFTVYDVNYNTKIFQIHCYKTDAGWKFDYSMCPENPEYCPNYSVFAPYVDFWFDLESIYDEYETDNYCSNTDTWTMFGHDAQHTGQSASLGDRTGNLKWHYDVGAWYEPAVASDGTIYITSVGLHALNADGTVKWIYNPPSNFVLRQSPSIGPDGTIYVCGIDVPLGPTSNEYIFAINPDGTLKWNSSYSSGRYYQNDLTIAQDGTIYAAESSCETGINPGLFAINPDGSLKWTFIYNYNGNYCGGTYPPAIGLDGTVYVTFDGLYALYPENGEVKWHISTVAAGVPAVDKNGVIYVSNYNLYAINPDGTLKWTISNVGYLNNWVVGPSIGSDGIIYVTPNIAINPDGTVKRRGYAGQINTRVAISSDGILYSGDCSWAATDAATGQLIWAYSDGASNYYNCFSSPAIGPGGTVYYSSPTGLYAFGD